MRRYGLIHKVMNLHFICPILLEKKLKCEIMNLAVLRTVCGSTANSTIYVTELNIVMAKQNLFFNILWRKVQRMNFNSLLALI